MTMVSEERVYFFPSFSVRGSVETQKSLPHEELGGRYKPKLRCQGKN